MGINGKGANVVKGEQADTVCHFPADAEPLQQQGNSFFIGTAFQPFQPAFSFLAGAVFCHAENIFIPIAETQSGQAGKSLTAEGFRRGERKYRESSIDFCAVPEPLTQRFDAPADPNDIVVLGDEEADDGFPQILLQDPYPAPIFCSGLQIAVTWINGIENGAIVGVQIEIFSPESVKGFFCTGKQKASFPPIFRGLTCPEFMMEGRSNSVSVISYMS